MLKQTNLKKVAMAFCLLLTAFNSKAQNPVWTLPPNYKGPLGIVSLPSVYSTNFNNTPSPSWNNDGYADFAHAMMPDAQGNPLFYLVDGYVFDKNFNNLGPSGYPLTYHDITTIGGVVNGGEVAATGYSGVLILPDPANCKQYYILSSGALGANIIGGHPIQGGITVGSPGSNNFSTWYGATTSPYNTFFYGGVPNWFHPFYSIIDVSNIGTSTPALTTFNSNPVSTAHTLTDIIYASYTTSYPTRGQGIYYAASDVITASPYNYRWVFISDGGSIYQLKFTGSATSTPFTLVSSIALPNAISFGLIFSNTDYDVRAEMELVVNSSNGNYEIAAPYTTSTGYNIFLAQLNGGSSANISSPVSQTTIQYNNYGANIHGLEFQPDGSNLYVTHDAAGAYTNPIEVISTTSPYTKSALSGTGVSNFAKSQIEAYTDGKLYFADASNIATYEPSSTTWNATAASISYATTDGTTDYYAGFPITSNVNSFLLPTQVDGMNYATFQKPNTACCLFYTSYDKQMYSATNSFTGGYNQTWSSTSNPLNGGTGATVTIGGELRIPAGYSVTINNMTIKFSPQARLIIENGATSINGGKLTLNGCTLMADNRCITDMWPGVQVWGTQGNTTQSNAYDGFLFLSNTQIQDAYTGVMAGYSSVWASATTPNPGAPTINPSNLSLGTNGGGGIVQTQGSTFLNNKTDVNIMPYTATSIASGAGNILVTTNFNCTSTLLNTSVTPNYHIVISNNNLNTYFGSDNISNMAFLYTEYGINATNSSFNIDNSVSACTISNQLYGIYVLNSGGNTNTFRCHGNTFTDNKVGVYFGLVPAAIVENNSISIWNKSSGNASGIYIDNSDAFWVQNNTITKGSGTFPNNRYGIVANNVGGNANSINNNTISYVYKGSQAQYVNYSATTQQPNGTGLLYLCNVFTANTISGADIYVPGIGSSTNVGGTYTGGATIAGIGYAQGNGNNNIKNRITADNQFSHTSGGKDFWIETTNTYLSNYEYQTPSGCGVTSSVYYPLVNNNISTGCSSTFATPNCSTGGNGHRTVQQNPVTFALADAADYKQLYDELISLYNDGNHTDTLSQQIASAFSGRHLALNDAVRVLLHTNSYDSIHMGDSLMKVKALELPTRYQIETALNLRDSIWATQSLAKLVAEEGQSNYIKLYTLLVNNIGKTPEQIMQNQSTVDLMQYFDKDSTDRNIYLRANALLHTINKSDYVPYIQPEDSIGNDIAMRKKLNNDFSTSIISESSLINSPNPFKESTTVKAVVVEKTQNAFIVITDMVGNEIARYAVQQGENNINVNAGNLNQSVMFCTLVVDGVKIKTNKMVLIK